jgi:hypothetical protein
MGSDIYAFSRSKGCWPHMIEKYPRANLTYLLIRQCPADTETAEIFIFRMDNLRYGTTSLMDVALAGSGLLQIAHFTLFHVGNGLKSCSY